MRSAVGHLGRRVAIGCCFVCRRVHTCHFLNCSLLFQGEAQLYCTYQSTVPHCYRVGSMSLLSLPLSKSLLPKDRQSLRMDTRSLATPVARLPEFESTDNLLKTFVPLGQKTKKNGGDNKSSNLRHLEQLRRLVYSLRRNPDLAGEAWKVGLVPKLIEFSRCGVSDFEQQARMALSLVGYAPPYSGRGLRILSVDGGGTRGLIPIIILKRLEELCGVKVYELFDYVCGTSTGALVSGLLFVKKSTLAETERTYRELSMEVFKMNNLLGISQLFLNHAFYDYKLLEKIVRRNKEAELMMYETSAQPVTPRISVVSTVVNQPIIQPFLFCNYRHHPDNLKAAHYLSSCNARGWEAVMASTAAPGYFEEVKLGNFVHQDGGLLTNNPCAVAVHEARLLWGRKTPIQCVISLGTGLYRERINKPQKKKESNTSLKGKLTKIVASATDTEAVHTILKDLLPRSTYYRFNPELTEDIAIDESRPEKLEQLVQDADNYIRNNHELLKLAAASLTADKQPHQRAEEWVRSQWNKAQSKFSSLR